MEDKIRHLKNKKIIRDGQEEFVKVGMALMDIKDTKTYLLDSSSFEEFCKKEYGFTKRYALFLISSSAVVEDLPEDAGPLVPSERAARALGKLPKNKRAKVIRKIVKSGKIVTTETIAEVVKSDETPKLEVERDELGVPIPAKVSEIWARREEVQGMLSQLSAIKCAVDKGIKDNDPLYRELSNTAVADLKQAYHALAYALPYTVCTGCNGQLIEKCLLCKGRGFLSKERYRTVPEETRSLREKVNSK